MNTQSSRTELWGYSMSMLKRRGFLIDWEKESAYISDNAHPDDQAFLNCVLEENNIGHMDGCKLCMEHLENSASLEHLFEPTESISMEMCWCTNYQWWRFAYFNHGIKVRAEILEPNIAYYCKALSACGLDTISSCDGNHAKEESTLFVLFQSPAYTFWHLLLWELILQKRFSVKWGGNCTHINLTAANRKDVYDTLFYAADYLYNNRVCFRKLKKDATMILQRKFRRDNCDDAIKQALKIKTEELLNSDLYYRCLFE